MPGVRTRYGPPSPNPQRSLRPVGCTPTPAPDTWHHLWKWFLHSAAWAAASLKVAGVRGEMAVISKQQACLYPNPEPTHQLDVC